MLFREAERLEIGLWLRRLFREKEALPSAGQAFFCFAVIMALRWASRSWMNPAEFEQEADHYRACRSSLTEPRIAPTLVRF